MGKDEKGAYGNSVLSVQYFCKLKTALKNSILCVCVCCTMHFAGSQFSDQGSHLVLCSGGSES